MRSRSSQPGGALLRTRASTPLLDHSDEDSTPLVKAVDRIMRHADKVRRMRVRAPMQTRLRTRQRARRMGAEGIGLLRTEHMFLGDRKQYVEKLILSATKQRSERRLAVHCCHCSARTSSGSSRRWTGCR